MNAEKVKKKSSHRKKRVTEWQF